MAIHYYEEGIKSGLKQRRSLSAFLLKTVEKFLPEKKTADITFVFCTDEFLLQINKDFLSHDTYTDIITFDLSDRSDRLSAEIYISIERVKENAQKFDNGFLYELHRVIFHGVLHLCGFKDKSKSDKELMRSMEDKCLQAYFNQTRL